MTWFPESQRLHKGFIHEHETAEDGHVNYTHLMKILDSEIILEKNLKKKIRTDWSAPIANFCHTFTTIRKKIHSMFTWHRRLFPTCFLHHCFHFHRQVKFKKNLAFFFLKTDAMAFKVTRQLGWAVHGTITAAFTEERFRKGQKKKKKRSEDSSSRLCYGRGERSGSHFLPRSFTPNKSESEMVSAAFLWKEEVFIFGFSSLIKIYATNKTEHQRTEGRTHSPKSARVVGRKEKKWNKNKGTQYLQHTSIFIFTHSYTHTRWEFSLRY